MINIQTLKFSNMFSYGKDVSIEFDSRVTQLVGKNGSGKSSIPAVLEDLFYNKTSRGVKKKSIKNRNIEDTWYSSECSFDINSTPYTLSKRVTSKTELKLVQGNKDLSGHTTTQTYKVIEELLGMDFNTFTKLVYQSMLSNLDFLVATDANRKKFLTSLLGLEQYTEVAAKVKEVITETKTAIASTESSIKSLKSLIPTSIPSKKEKMEVPSDDRLEELEKELAKLQAQNTEVELINQKIKTNNEAISKLAGLKKVAAPEEPKFDYDVKKRKDELTRRLAVAESDLKTLSMPATKCPTCGTPYNNEDHADHIANKKSELEHTIVQIKRDLETVIADNSKLLKYETDVQKYNNYLVLKGSYESNIDISLSREPQSTKPTSSLEAEIKQIRTDIKDAEKFNSEIESYNAKIDTKIEQQQKLKDTIEKDSAKLRVYNTRKEKLDLLSEAFGTKGLISYKIESMTKAFEKLINDYLTIFSDGRFNLVFQVEDTKLALKLYDSGEEIEINSLSSGEFNKVNTSTLLAIRKMMVAVSKININILFLDEVVSVLDTESKDTLIEVLLNESELNSIVVSHGYSHPLAKTIKIKNNNGVSEIYGQ